MKTLILKHGGHEAHVPYELPDSLRFDCFVPNYGILAVTVDPRAEDVSVTCVETKEGECLCSTLVDHDAVLEQAGDVCAVFERGLSALEKRGLTNQGEMDARALETIATLAHHEKEAEIAFYLLPGTVRSSIPMLRYSHNGMAEKALAAFITNVLVPRAQGLATAEAKRREAEWNEEQDARCEHCGGSGEGRCGGRCPCCSGRGRPTARLTSFAKEGA